MRFYHKCTYVFTSSTLYACQIVIKIEICRQILEKYVPSIVKIRPVGAEVFHADRQT